VGLLAGGLAPGDVAAAVRRTGARIVHAHNLSPAFGPRALAAARAAGARVVVHLHNYRTVCAVGTCFTRGADCTRCHGRNTAPGIALNCRGTGPEALVYGVALAAWQRRLAGLADRFVVPSAFAEGRLRALGAPLGDRVSVVGHAVRAIAPAPAFDPDGPALVVSRLAVEKGVDVAIAACRRARVPLVVAGDGPQRAELEAAAAGADVRFVGRVGDRRLAQLRAAARAEIVPSRAAETFGLAAAEAMAAGLPVVATRSGALAELVPADRLVPAGDAEALAAALGRADARAAAAGLEAVRALCAPETVARALADVYAAV
jgi:glycosyltransferase involved in cell wall biosynthesis